MKKNVINLLKIKTKQSGFSLLELMVALAIVAILAAIAFPSFTTMISDNRMLTSAQDITNSLQFARSEAIKRGTAVTLCPSTNGTSCSATASLDAGWIIFIDNTTPGVVDNSNNVNDASPGDIIVYRNQQSGGSVSVKFEAGRTYLRFSSQGFLT
jgi:type IV fimbrial biogenesis protein FimT